MRSARVALVFAVLFAAAGGAFTAALDAQGKPVIVHDDTEDTFVTGFCGFPMEVRTTGTGIFHEFYDADGALEKVIITAAAVRLSFTNLFTGESVWTPSVNMTRIVIGDTSAVQSYRGLLWRLVVPHEGLVTADAGRIDFSYTFDEDGEPVFEGVTFSAGQQDNQFIQAVCAELAS